ncbi:MAG: outer membrane protein assembly factor BamD [Planctomycetes bacterium]|nr:outer membrane protein assembly factor BamD [Planctomycetota bacterium]
MHQRVTPHAIAAVLASLVWIGPGSAGDPDTPGYTFEFDTQTEEWSRLEPLPRGTPGGDLEHVKSLLDQGDTTQAGREIKRWFKQYDDQEVWRPEALIARARVELAMDHYQVAHEVLQEFLATYPASPLDGEVLHLEFTIAETFLGGTKRKLLGIRMLSGEEIALGILDDISLNYPQSPYAELALKTKADYFFNRGEFLLAEMEYSRLAESFPRSRYLRYSLRKSADAALESFSGIEFDAAGLIEADERYREYLQRFPNDPQRGEIILLRERIYSSRADKELEIGRYHERARQLQAAAFYYRSTVETWPGSIAAARAERRLQELDFGGVATSESPAAPSNPDTHIRDGDTP